MLKKIIVFIIKLFNINIEEDTTIYNKTSEKEVLYHKKTLLSKVEYDFYLKIKCLEVKYKIVPQLNLASIIHKENSKYRTELFRNVDFAIFSMDYGELLLLIELNDSTHNQYNRKDRDLKVKKICNECDIKLITFYTSYPNEQNYVIQRIEKEIEKIKEGKVKII